MAALNAVAASRVLAVLVAASTLTFVRHGEAPWASLAVRNSLKGHAIVEVEKTEGAFLSKAANLPTPQELYAVQPHDSYTEKKSWKDTLAEMIAGFLCFFMAIGILWLNEGHAVRMDQLFQLAVRRLKEVSGGTTSTENLRELIFTSGSATTSDTLELRDWAKLTAPDGSAKLRAKLWMYQWVEEKKDKDNTTTYEYKKVWTQSQINSAGFKYSSGHENPTAPQPFTSLELATASLGSFTFSKRMLGLLQAWKPCDVQSKLEDFKALPSLSEYSKAELSTHHGRQSVFFGKSGTPGSPEIGDLQVIFEFVPCGVASILGVQVEHQNQVAPWTMVPLQYVTHHSYTPMLSRASTMTTNVGDSKHETLLGEAEADEYIEETHDPMKHIKRGAEKFLEGFPWPMAMADKFMTAACPDNLLVVVEKTATPKEAIAGERAFERKLTYTMRLFGFALMYVAAEAIFSPLKRVLSYLWIFGSILAMGIHCFTFLCACSCGTCTIAGAYMAYRPLYSVMLFTFGIGIWVLLSGYQSQTAYSQP